MGFTPVLWARRKLRSRPFQQQPYHGMPFKCLHSGIAAWLPAQPHVCVCVCPGPRKAPFSTNTPIFTNYFFTLKVISAAVVVSLLWNTFPLLHPAPMGRTRSLCSFQTKRWIVVKNCFCVIQVCPAGYFSRRKLRFSFPIFFFPWKKALGWRSSCLLHLQVSN